MTSDAVAMADTAGGRPAIRPLVARLRDTLDGAAALGREFDTQAAHSLHDLIMPPAIRAVLHGKSRVAIVTSDALSRIPFSVLLASRPENGSDFAAINWAVRHHAFSTALTPSSAFSGSDESANIESFLGIGVPAQGSEIDSNGPAFRGALYSGADLEVLPALPGAVAEIAAVAKASRAAQTRVLSGALASERQVRNEIRTPADIVLFATHGLVAGEIGGLREPALVLSRPEEAEDGEDDGFLLASEIAALDFGSDLVILSACNSAAGRSGTAPAYTGLANAFLSAGSRNLMLSHWRVRDDAAAQLTAGAVEAAAAGGDFAFALQKAQLRMLDEARDGTAFAHPAFWAPYIVIGD
ncbi:CHAT domain-containing protein [Croceicoccus sediminis]|uniref:CHAT domain-containing protein n=1 Tax=Croceicoccus sediminis TaxID=2571150 RepID=UPI00196A279C|nr:CHAT domain-containing protein [Croceicoccus sediminis]